MTLRAEDEKDEIFLPKKFGWGLTLNFGRPVSWLLLILAIALGVLIPYLVRHWH